MLLAKGRKKSSHTEAAKECVTEEMVRSEAAATADTKRPVMPGAFENTVEKAVDSFT